MLAYLRELGEVGSKLGHRQVQEVKPAPLSTPRSGFPGERSEQLVPREQMVPLAIPRHGGPLSGFSQGHSGSCRP